jgi:hypothetical protein
VEAARPVRRATARKPPAEKADPAPRRRPYLWRECRSGADARLLLISSRGENRPAARLRIDDDWAHGGSSWKGLRSENHGVAGSIWARAVPLLGRRPGLVRSLVSGSGPTRATRGSPGPWMGVPVTRRPGDTGRGRSFPCRLASSCPGWGADPRARCRAISAPRPPPGPVGGQRPAERDDQEQAEAGPLGVV